MSPRPNIVLLRAAAAGFTLLPSLTFWAQHQNPMKGGAQSPRPLQATLVAELNATHVHPGSMVFARAQTEWAEASCLLPPGSLVEGHVVAVLKRSKANKSSSLQLVFDKADCKGNRDLSPRFTLLAIVGSVAGSAESGTSEGPPLSNDLPLTIGGNGGGIRNAGAASALTNTMVSPVRNLPSQLHPGEVIDLPRTHLQVVTGAESTTTVIADGRDVRLKAGTILVLLSQTAEAAKAPAASVPNSGGESPSKPALVARGPSGSSAANVAPPEQPDITDICASACTTIENGTSHTIEESQASGTVLLDHLGFPLLGNRELPRFTQDATVVYLDAGHLLCTFDPHRLRERTELDAEPTRTIRAVLVRTADFAIERIFDWRVRGNGQYLWRLPLGHLLVHLGRELREFDADLKPLRSVHLDGRLAWVVAAPSANHIVVGTVRERYSTWLRKDLEASMPEDPEEDIQVRVLDGNLQELLTAVRSSHTPVPVITDTGELRVRRDATGRWKLLEVDWQRQEHVLSEIRSSCRPIFTVPEHDLIFLMGCTAEGNRWYRMLHGNGHPILKDSSPDRIEQQAQASAAHTFAIRTVETLRGLALNQPFRPSDLRREHIDVYSDLNGARLFTVASTDFALSEMNFALSLDGTQLVLIGRQALHFFSVGHISSR